MNATTRSVPILRPRDEPRAAVAALSAIETSGSQYNTDSKKFLIAAA
jgi:hypothetical protein